MRAVFCFPLPLAIALALVSGGVACLGGCSSSSALGGGANDASVESATGTGDDGGSDATVSPDPLAAQRAACTFTAGALAKDTLGLDEAARAKIPIKNIVVMMKENRSFDHMLGLLHTMVPSVEPIPASFTNPGIDGGAVAPFHQTSTCIPFDPDHQWTAMHTQVDDGGMDGFIKSAHASTSGNDGTFVMSYYTPADIPFYYFLASTFPVNDRHFASARSGTDPDRNFMLLGTPDGVQSTGDGLPLPTTPTIFDLLDTAHVTWGAYSDGSLLGGTVGWTTAHAGTGSFATFLQLLDSGTLPQVAFVDGIDNVTDDHPTANVQDGEAWTRAIYEHATASKLWPGLAIVWTYDEGGGFFDHVPPPNKACVPRPSDPPVGGNGAPDSLFTELGVRIPLVVISPYARAGYTSHVVQEHTAITRFIEAVFGLPALTARDANSDALLDMFDFQGPPAFLTPPAAPMAGMGGCGNVQLTVSSPNIKVGTPFTISFTGGPGNNTMDWIAIYPYTAAGPAPPTPSPGALMWQYIGGTQTPGTTAPTSGTITIDMTAAAADPWPLPVGSYIAYYLLKGGYASIASINFNITN